MSDETTTEATEVEDTEGTHGPSTPEDIQPADTPDDEDQADEPEVFPREVVEKLRGENAKYRRRAQAADELAHRLHVELVRATGRLADPTDLPFDEDHLADPDTMVAAIDELLEAKPHLATRRPSGDIGQGQRGPASGAFSLLDMLKART